jgi:signal transduction histidine kinase
VGLATGPWNPDGTEALARIVDDAAARVGPVHDRSRRQEDRLEAVDLEQIVAEAVALARTELEQHEMIWGRRFRLLSRVTELPPVQAIPAELKHVFVNLIFNARDAMPLGGTVTVDGRREKDFAVITGWAEEFTSSGTRR